MPIGRLVPVLVALGAALTAVVPAPASAQPRPGPVDVIEVEGWLDPVLVDFTRRALQAAERRGGQALVVQLDSPGALVSDADLEALAFRMRHSALPVAVWVGPTGARAYGGAARLLEAAAVPGMAQGASVGRFTAQCRSRPGIVGVCPESTPLRTPRALGAREAERRGGVAVVAPTLGDFLVDLDGREVDGRVLTTARVVEQGDLQRRQPSVQVRFAKLGLLDRVLHATARPGIAYLLLVAGLLLVVFEFFTVGVGVVGAVGAACLVLASYGLAVLPTRGWALLLVLFAVAGFSIDVQAGAPRTWTAIGTAVLLVASRLLFGGGITISWLSVVLVMAGVLLFMLVGMPSMLRARFSTPTLGRESMIGEMGEATTGIDPEGTVRLRGGLWRARTHRATPIEAGLPVRVVGIDGLLLEVEPEEGGAKEFPH